MYFSRKKANFLLLMSKPNFFLKEGGRAREMSVIILDALLIGTASILQSYSVDFVMSLISCLLGG